jgi:hypothetical protein
MSTCMKAGQSAVSRFVEDGMLTETTVTHLGRGLYRAVIRLEGWGEADGSYAREKRGYDNAVRSANDRATDAVSAAARRRRVAQGIPHSPFRMVW